jgi:parallel beta-helix repeat protein
LVFALGVTAATILPSHAAKYAVTSLSDAPSRGTLRWAINQANAHSGGTIAFDVSGTITLSAPLPNLTSPVQIDGSTAPRFKGSPIVAINFAGKTGLIAANGADGSLIQSLSLVNASNSAVTLGASRVTVAGSYIGLSPDGAPVPNGGDGVKVLSSSKANLIGGFDPITGFQYFDTTNDSAFTVQPVTAWQGLRNYTGTSGQFLICGTSGDNGLLYVGPLAGGGKGYLVQKPRATVTSVYGPDNLKNGVLRLVGSFRTSNDPSVFNHGFVWEGKPGDLPSGGIFRNIDYPGATYQFTHSTMGGLAVGNADGPTKGGAPIGPGRAYIYDIEKRAFVANIRYPGSKSNTAYGIWYNGHDKYTICGGYSPLPVNNLKNQDRPLAQGRAYLVDYDSKTRTFSNWTTFRYRNSANSRSFITHFEGISSAEDGVYTMNADSVKRSSKGPAQGSWVSVRRNPDGSFSKAQWVDLNFPGVKVGVTSSNSVYGNHVVGLVVDATPASYQATVDVGFTLSNVISANKGNGIGIYGSQGNIVAQNYIGTNPAGTASLGNKMNGILVTGKASRNLIGGQEAGRNNPTGSEKNTKPVYIVPPQGNLISGNKGNGVLITNGSSANTLSGNFVGTDGSGNKALGNSGDGVRIERADGNKLIGCTLRQNPFVFYNVISGNGRDGVHLESADDTTVQANFLGISANNHILIPNRRDGLAVAGSSADTQVGGVIPLGNVISGNAGNGISVSGTANGFISFNTFGGGFAFGNAAPNGRNGILITSTGGNNTIQTCILSGNTGNGLEIGGNATGVQVTDTACGTNTAINAPLPNGGSGVLISGTAHGNVLGGLQPSIEGRTHFSGNSGYGVAIIDGAHDNNIYNSNIGIGHVQPGFPDPTIPNQLGGVYLGAGTSGTTIGGSGLYKNYISVNNGAGLAIISSTLNTIPGNEIKNNATYGVFATGPCTGTTISGNTITGNTPDVDISGATGITYTP